MSGMCSDWGLCQAPRAWRRRRMEGFEGPFLLGKIFVHASVYKRRIWLGSALYYCQYEQFIACRRWVQTEIVRCENQQENPIQKYAQVANRLSGSFWSLVICLPSCCISNIQRLRRSLYYSVLHVYTLTRIVHPTRCASARDLGVR